jgi:hypothetical protein
VKKRRPTRAEALAALKRETEDEIRQQVRDLLSVPMIERMHFLLVPVKLPNGRTGWCL